MNVDADMVIESFGAAGDENRLSGLRKGQVVELPAQGEVWMTGDIHDHRNNFNKFINAADLPNHPNRHVILHELIHGDHYDASGAEDSWRLLHLAAELKNDFPNQVHFLMANHDLAQIHGEGIMKNGASVCEAFNAGVKRDFGPRATLVTVAITEYLLSLPLAIRTPGGMWFSHSLPTDEQIKTFDYSVFQREQLTPEDYRRRVGPVYQLIWGRKMTPDGVAEFAEKVGAKGIVTGHQPQDSGFKANGEQHLIIASDHNQGVMLPMDLDKAYTSEQLIQRVQKFNSLGSEVEEFPTW